MKSSSSSLGNVWHDRGKGDAHSLWFKRTPFSQLTKARRYGSGRTRAGSMVPAVCGSATRKGSTGNATVVARSGALKPGAAYVSEAKCPTSRARPPAKVEGDSPLS